MAFVAIFTINNLVLLLGSVMYNLPFSKINLFAVAFNSIFDSTVLVAD